MNEQKRRKKRGYVILPREDGRWLLTREGTPSESHVFSTIAEAVEAGRKLARKERVPLRVLAGKKRPSRNRGRDRGNESADRSHGISES